LLIYEFIFVDEKLVLKNLGTFILFY